VGVAVAALALLFGSPRAAGAQVTVVQEPDRPNGLLYSADTNFNCSDLHALAMSDPATLPYNVVRLTAQAVGADTYTWSLPKPQVGFLLADDDLGPQETTAAIRGFCSEFGNACLLTKKSLKTYNKPTVLYAAPTCDVLPKDTSKPFAGGSVMIKVAAKAANKKLGKASTEVRWGAQDPTAGTVTLWVNYPGNPIPAVRTAANGDHVESVQGFALTDFNAVPTPLGLPGLPAITSFQFSFGGSGSSEPSCPDDETRVCTELEAPTAGKLFSTVVARLADGSALCDALNVQVGVCPRKAQVQIIRVPSKRTYKSGDLVRLRVRFANLSVNRPGCGLLLSGANVLGCSATFKLGKTQETKSDQWDLQHCSTSADVTCQTDADCAPLGETCLNYSHCSQTLARPCSSDSECGQDVCPTCKEDETCIHVLEIPAIDVEPGQAVDLVDETVTLKNEIGSPVGISETWTANAFPGTSASAGIKYQIKDAD
jgi:hypothetical protein